MENPQAFYEQQPVNTRRDSMDSDTGGAGSGGSGGSGGGGSGLGYSSSSMRLDGSGSLTPFVEVRLGGLLGKGSFGSVYCGWRGKEMVAVKVGKTLKGRLPDTSAAGCWAGLLRLRLLQLARRW